MIAKDPVQSRPGGRSSRVQASVHQAVRKLLERMPREELTFPLIATQAGVTPSTLYRRWGDLPQLLADVALERIRPIAEPADTGSLHGDLQAWTEQYIEEMGSPLGRTLLRDTLVATQEDQVTCACVDIIRDQLGIVLSRAGTRGESGPDVDTMLDQLVAPIVYRILYGLQPDVAFGRKLVEQLAEHLTPKQA